MLKEKLYSAYSLYKEFKNNENILSSSEFEKRRIEAEIIRNVHSIEKGLSIKSPRAGFGIKKINEMFSLTEKYMQLTDEKTVLYFVVDAVDEYLEFQSKIGFESTDITTIRANNDILKEKIGEHEEICGGTVTFNKEDINFTAEAVENLFDTRHSFREFTGEPVPEELIEKAIKLAQRTPSACNRQAVRVYNISSKDYINAVGNLEGIGGFADDVDRFLLITGVKSAYRRGEKNQFIVSAAMFAAYLSLSLHAVGIGACVVQRSLVEDKIFVGFRQKFDIPEDEQIVVMLGIGMPNEKTKVPVSKRLPLDRIYRKLGE